MEKTKKNAKNDSFGSTYDPTTIELKWPSFAKALKDTQAGETYNHSSIEPYWQSKWSSEKVYQPDISSANSPFFNLMMFPYPSAEGMHVGNMYAFTGADVYGRFMRMQGKDVFEPIGLDGFGIHSENYALKIGKHPMDQAKVSEANFYRQMKATGNGYDWSRTVETYDPDYYRWTQWLFIKLFQNGLAYRKKATVNFCPSCKTVLADEQVIDGKCERCSSEVEKRALEQWFFKITEYAERLLNNIDTLNWTEKVKIAQRNWIGKSEGARIQFSVFSSQSSDTSQSVVSQLVSETDKLKTGKLKSDNRQLKTDNRTIDVFTTRPDTLFGATFLVISPEHPIAKSVNDPVVKKYLTEAGKQKDAERLREGKEKTGVFSGLYAVHPLTKEEIPVWIAGYVLMGYGTGAIMGVPAHDQRDYEFAKKYDLAIKEVIASNAKQPLSAGKQGETDGIATSPSSPRNDKKLQVAYVGTGKIINSGSWDGWKYPKDLGRVIADLEAKGIGKKEVQFHLRDWLISRQRYWGPPIPMIYCQRCADKGDSWFTKNDVARVAKVSRVPREEKTRDTLGTLDTRDTWSAGWYPVPDDQLPVALPHIKNYKPLGTGTSPLASHEEFYKTTCPGCGGDARRETDVSDTFLDSSWYFLRYPSTDIETAPFDTERTKKWLPVDMYIGGAEHSVLHLLYSRFITMVLKDLGYIDFEEPFSRFFAHGLLIKEGAKMSKSKGNVIVPDEYIKKYGADTLRCYLMFIGPFNQGGDFYDTGIEGMHRFLKRVWRLIKGSVILSVSEESPTVSVQRMGSSRSEAAQDDKGSLQVLHKTIKKVTDDVAHLRYNTAIAALMEWYNFLAKQSSISQEEAETFLKLLAPFAPHMTEELLQQMANGKWQMEETISDKAQRAISHKQFQSIHVSHWPTYDPKHLVADEVTIAVQVNGKVRDTIRIKNPPAGEAGQELRIKENVEQKAKESEKVKKYVDGKEIKKVIYIVGKVINFVVL